MAPAFRAQPLGQFPTKASSPSKRLTERAELTALKSDLIIIQSKIDAVAARLSDEKPSPHTHSRGMQQLEKDLLGLFPHDSPDDQARTRLEMYELHMSKVHELTTLVARELSHLIPGSPTIHRPADQIVDRAGAASVPLLDRPADLELSQVIRPSSACRVPEPIKNPLSDRLRDDPKLSGVSSLLPNPSQISGLMQLVDIGSNVVASWNNLPHQLGRSIFGQPPSSDFGGGPAASRAGSAGTAAATVGTPPRTPGGSRAGSASGIRISSANRKKASIPTLPPLSANTLTQSESLPTPAGSSPANSRPASRHSNDSGRTGNTSSVTNSRKASATVEKVTSGKVEKEEKVPKGHQKELAALKWQLSAAEQQKNDAVSRAKELAMYLKSLRATKGVADAMQDLDKEFLEQAGVQLEMPPEPPLPIREEVKKQEKEKPGKDKKAQLEEVDPAEQERDQQRMAIEALRLVVFGLEAYSKRNKEECELQVANLEQELERSRSECETLAHDKTQLEISTSRTIEELEQRLQEESETRERIERSEEEMLSKLAVVQPTVLTKIDPPMDYQKENNYKLQLSRKEKYIEDLHKQVANLEGELEKTRSELSATQSDLEESRREIPAAEEKIRQLTSMAQYKVQDSTGLERKLAAAGAKQGEMGDKIEELKEQIRALRFENQEARDKATHIQDLVKKEREEWKERETSLSDALMEERSAHQDTAQRISAVEFELKQQIIPLKSKLSSAEKEAKDAKEAKQEMSEKLESFEEVQDSLNTIKGEFANWAQAKTMQSNSLANSLQDSMKELAWHNSGAREQWWKDQVQTLKAEKEQLLRQIRTQGSHLSGIAPGGSLPGPSPRPSINPASSPRPSEMPSEKQSRSEVRSEAE